MAFDLGHGLCLVGLGEVDLEIFALADMLDAIEAQGAEGALDGLALRVEHAFLERDLDLRLHAQSFFTSRGLERSGCSFSAMMPRRLATS